MAPASSNKSAPSKIASKDPGSRAPPVKRARKDAPASESESEEEEVDAYEEAAAVSSDSEEDEAAVDSDAIDDDVPAASASKKRKAPVKPAAAAKGKGKAANGGLEDDVPAGQVSQRLLDFMGDLKKPECQDRDWFTTPENDARYRSILRNFTAFVDAVSEQAMAKNDWTIPVYPAKDLIYRIYRDVRFSKDKRPCASATPPLPLSAPDKSNMTASFSRTGRKGPYAGYFIFISNGGTSFLRVVFEQDGL